MAKQLTKQDKTIRWTVYALFVLTFIFYGNSLKNGYALDDRYVTVTNEAHPDNPRIAKGWKGIPEIFSTRYVVGDQQDFDYRPIPLVTFAIEYQFFGSNAFVNHFVNVLLYALTCILLFLTLLKIVPSGNILFPLLTSVVFLMHPIHTEVVDNIKSRDELLCFLFGLLSFFKFLNLRAGFSMKDFIYTFLFLLLSLLCKKTGFLFVFMIIMGVYFFFNAGSKKWILPLLGIVVAILSFVVLKRMLLTGGAELRKFTFYENPLFFERGAAGRLVASFFSSGYYLRLLLFPYPLCSYYGYNAIANTGFTSPWVWFSLLGNGLILYLVVKKIRQKEIFAWAGLLYFIGLMPFINLFFPTVGILGERFIYFSSFGFCMMLAMLLINGTKSVFDKPRKGVTGMSVLLKRIAIALLLVCSVAVISRNAKWKDLLSLSTNDVQHFDDSFMLQAITANNLYAKSVSTPGPAGRAMAEEAKTHFKRASEILQRGLEKYPGDISSSMTLAGIYVYNLARPADALPLFEKVLQADPKNEEAQFNCMNCLYLLGKQDTALYICKQMFAQGSKYRPLYLKLHEIYTSARDYEAAKKNDSMAVSVYRTDVQLTLNLGNDFIFLGDTLKGLACFERAASLAPNDYNLLMNVAGVFGAAGSKSKEQEYRNKALLLKKH